MYIRLSEAYRYINENEFYNHNAVVIDVLRATSTMITALYNGCRHIVPVKKAEDAIRMQKDMDLVSEGILGGEQDAKRISGFDLGNSPLEYTRDNIGRKVIFLSTTNGTNAIVNAKHAKKLYIGALNNASAVARRVAAGAADTIISCAGTGGELSVDDFLTAGAIIDRIKNMDQEVRLNDSAIAAQRLYQMFCGKLGKAMAGSLHYEKLKKLKFDADIEYCLREDIIDLVPQYNDGLVVK